MISGDVRIEETPLFKRVWFYEGDGVEIGYLLATTGTRIGAALIDHLLQFILYFVFALTFHSVVMPLISLENSATPISAEGLLKSLAGGIMIIVLFILNQGYFILFETLWGGETPGKRILSIRVITDTGERVGIREVFIRNLLRVADILPFFYLIGGMVTMIDPLHRRLGDITAGTMVIKTFAPAELKLKYPLYEKGIITKIDDDFNSLLQNREVSTKIRENSTRDDARHIREALLLARFMEPKDRVPFLRKEVIEFKKRVGIEGFDFIPDDRFLANILRIVENE